MENVSRTIELNQVCQILTVGATLVNTTSTTSTSTEATSTEATSTETTHAHAHTTPCHVVATVEHATATVIKEDANEVKEAILVSIAIDETKIVGELSEIWSAVRNNEVNLNELFSTEVSFLDGCMTIAIAPKVATV